MKCAISHAILGTSYVAVLPDDPADAPSVLRLRSDEDKERFMLDTLKEGDKFYCENGGVSDRIALIGLARGAKVFRVPTFRVGSGRITQDGEISETPLAKRVSAMHWPIAEEKAAGNETGHELTVRRLRAAAILAMSVTDRHEFLAIGDPERRMLEVKRLYRAYRASQKVLLATYQRLLANYNDRYLLVMAAQSEHGVVTGKKVASAAVREAIDALLIGIPESEREQFVARLGLKKFFTRALIPRNEVRKMFRAIIEEMMKGSVMSPFLNSMKDLVKEIELRLKQEKIHEAVFAPLPGCGPLIASRMMASIVDIRRFASAPALKAYAGYHHFEDGSRARRRTGTVSNWNQELKQAVYLWTQQTIKLKESPWRVKLDKRRAYELYKLLLNRQEQADDLGLKEEMLPAEYFNRRIENTYDMELADLEKLVAHVNALRLKAGIKPVKSDGEELDEEEQGELEAAAAKNPQLAKLTRGLKKMALDKAVRWLGQQLLKYIFKSWNDALCLPEIERQTRERKATVKADPDPETADQPLRKRTRSKKAA